MTIKLYNTATKQKEEFVPLVEGKAGVYVCGVTVYDHSHIGHARSAIVFDVLVKYFRARGMDVTYIRNFTDVDDKIIKRANELGKDTAALAREYIDSFYEDMDTLGVMRPDMEPRA
ncbi:MAG: class I tRNA ligase family protein, partial [Desulfobacteraceae bacterium]